VHGDKFTLDDFLLDGISKEPEKPPADITPKQSKVVRRTAPPAYKPPPKPQMTDGALKRELKKHGADSLVEAVQKLRGKEVKDGSELD
jgi:hypothetical protein